jgi:Ca-activated chloride channel family protein
MVDTARPKRCDKEFKEAAAKGEDASPSPALWQRRRWTPDDAQTRLVLPAQSERSVRLTYTEVLVGQVGLTRYTYALSNTNLTDEPIGDLLVNVKIIENDEIRTVYSPSHKEAEVARPEKNTAEVVYRAQNVTPSQNFELIYTKSTEKFGLNLASYRESASDDGYFVLIAAPQLEAKKDDVIQKDFVFILDRSGSMSGPKFEQARAALRNILDALNPEDRFTVVTFDDKVQSYSDKLESLERREDAKKWVAGLRPGGGTNINEALLAGLKTVDQSANRPHIVVFLTDGQATNGVTATTAILSNVREKIRPQSRIYTIGIGDVNQALLESLAQENRGTSLFVTATENVEKPLANFYAAIDSPVLVDLSLDFGGVEVYDLQPKKIPDMFLGGQVVLTGRYKPGKDLATVTLTGTINGQKHVSTYQNIKFITDAAGPSSTASCRGLQRKVDSLVICNRGPNPTLIE